MTLKKKINETRENRVYSSNVELRAKGDDSRIIEGYACKFGVWSRSLGWFKEKIDKDAFSDIDWSKQDVKALINHDHNLILARSNKNVDTLKLEVDETGLRFEFEAPNTTIGNDLLENVRNKNYQECSFAFIVKVDQWEEKEEGDSERTIMKFAEIFDISVVTDPAYYDTVVDVAKRSFDQYKKANEEENKPTPEQIQAETETRERELTDF